MWGVILNSSLTTRMPPVLYATPPLVLPWWWSQPGPTALPHGLRNTLAILWHRGMQTAGSNLNVLTKILNLFPEREEMWMVYYCTPLKLLVTLELIALHISLGKSCPAPCVPNEYHNFDIIRSTLWVRLGQFIIELWKIMFLYDS